MMTDHLEQQISTSALTMSSLVSRCPGCCSLPATWPVPLSVGTAVTAEMVNVEFKVRTLRGHYRHLRVIYHRLSSFPSLYYGLQYSRLIKTREALTTTSNQSKPKESAIMQISCHSQGSLLNLCLTKLPKTISLSASRWFIKDPQRLSCLCLAAFVAFQLFVIYTT